MNLKFDYIICGGGASGLSIASGLSLDQYFSNKKILIIDPEFPKKKNDRTWCFWENDKSNWDNLTHYKWEKVIFNSPQINKTISLNPLRYKMLKSMSYYKQCNDLILKNPNIQHINDKVIKVDDKGNFCEVKTENNIYKSKKVFNSILNWELLKNNSKYPLLIQHFEGWFIKTDKDVFNKKEATFMDFTIKQNSNTRFMYVLPFSKKEALIEFTLFSKDLLDKQGYEKPLTNYLKELGITNYNITNKESGKIPMTGFPFHKQNSKNIIYIGSAGGWSKPSTGYTFKNIERKSKLLLKFLKTKDDFKNFSKTTRFWFYDLIFLDVLYQNNHLGRKLFSQMFKNNQSKLIFKFLDEKSNFFDELKIMSSFSTGIFIKTILKRIFNL
ncbi:lycopene cyclase family protein [Flavobacteriaceae bacterium]|jgi:lycopene beta-cyclase|nr:lycopene cyclase family protein [Flavobacteriaceae bacterium]|tara:strand:+ start:2537 stop:3688 length:1152 start_codon:yes stop_codon:yes gene_type:complete